MAKQRLNRVTSQIQTFQVTATWWRYCAWYQAGSSLFGERFHHLRKDAKDRIVETRFQAGSVVTFPL